jgi:hypothetical protein
MTFVPNRVLCDVGSALDDRVVKFAGGHGGLRLRPQYLARNSRQAALLELKP